MSFRTLPSSVQPAIAARHGVESASWLSLVAATTDGLKATRTVRARIRARIRADQSSPGPMRLVVHSYEAHQLRDGTHPGDESRPRASSQRAVTREQLQRGIIVDMLPVGAGDIDESGLVVFAWLEKGRPDLEYDALLARPEPGAFRGVARAEAGFCSMSAELELTAA
jgi:hypothetical protein